MEACTSEPQPVDNPSAATSSLASPDESRDLSHIQGLSPQAEPPGASGLRALSPHRLLSSVVRSGVTKAAEPNPILDAARERAGCRLGEGGSAHWDVPLQPAALPSASVSETEELLVAAAIRLDAQVLKMAEGHQPEAMVALGQTGSCGRAPFGTLPAVPGASPTGASPTGAVSACGTGHYPFQHEGRSSWRVAVRRSDSHAANSSVKQPAPLLREDCLAHPDGHGVVGEAASCRADALPGDRGQAPGTQQHLTAQEDAAASPSARRPHQVTDRRDMLPPVHKLRFGSPSCPTLPPHCSGVATPGASAPTCGDAKPSIGAAHAPAGAASSSPREQRAAAASDAAPLSADRLQPHPAEASAASCSPEPLQSPTGGPTHGKPRVRVQAPASPPIFRQVAAAWHSAQRRSTCSPSPTREGSEQHLHDLHSRSLSYSTVGMRTGLLPSIPHTSEHSSQSTGLEALACLRGEETGHGSSPLTVQASLREHRASPEPGDEAQAEGSGASKLSGRPRASTSTAARRPVPYSAAETPILTPHNLPSRASHVGPLLGSSHPGGGPSFVSAGPLSAARHGPSGMELVEQPQPPPQPPQPLMAVHWPVIASTAVAGDETGRRGLRARSVSVQDTATASEPFSLRRSVYCDWVESAPLSERLGSVSLPGGSGSGLDGKAHVLKRHVHDRDAPIYFKPAYQKPLLGGDVLHVL